MGYTAVLPLEGARQDARGEAEGCGGTLGKDFERCGMSSELYSSAGDGLGRRGGFPGAGMSRGRVRTVAYRPCRVHARAHVRTVTHVPLAPPQGQSPGHHRHRRGHHARRRHLGRAKYGWSMIAGAVSFTGLYFLLFPRSLGVPPADQLLGNLALWPFGFLVLSGLFSLLVVFGFKLSSEAINHRTALRHYVGRRLAKLGLVVVMFNGGWLVALFMAVIWSLFKH